MYITDEVKYVGVNDHQVVLFEGQYDVPNGMAYNSYVIDAEQTAVIDTVDAHFTQEWFDNIESVLGKKEPDFLVIHHMEPDHSGSIAAFMEKYTKTTIVSSSKAFAMMGQFFGTDYPERQIIVKEGSTLAIGSHTLAFVEAPMVHWPEVVVSYDVKEKLLFSADGFGKFGALDVEEPWDDESRRYFIGIVGKYGKPVQDLLAKAATLDIRIICPTHGPVLKENLGHYLSLYNYWSSYEPEEEGIVVAYTSVYGHTKEAALKLADDLKAKGCPKVVVYNLAYDDMSAAVADAFRYNKLVLATTTYNADIFPFMHEFIHNLTERNFQKRTVALIENGSWAPMAAGVMKDMLKECEKLTFVKGVTIRSALNEATTAQLGELADTLCREYIAQSDKADKKDLKALFNIGYGLYVVTCKDTNGRDNGLIVNNVSQLTDSPNRLAVAINRANYSCGVVDETGILNVNCLSEEAPFSVFERFGFQSGRDTDKFAGMDICRSENGLVFLKKYLNAFMSLKVEQKLKFESHILFICSLEEARTFSSVNTMTYTYYQNYVKPKPKTDGVTGWVCKVCGYIYEGEDLPADYICPLCKHGVNDFEKL